MMVLSYKINTVNTTAAGDAYIGTLAKAFVEMGDLVAAAKYASAAGAFICTPFGAQPSLPTKLRSMPFWRCRNNFSDKFFLAG
ncbi:putative kinase [Acetobacterium woodii DSM 1030]|uniref:Putative kinase n=2 Tax=Acetobacterium woodii TaxID=33952 RepID=H6LKN5_ACEWD|nr:putative kinase [Acetobacterium woodii DSM 1030]